MELCRLQRKQRRIGLVWCLVASLIFMVLISITLFQWVFGIRMVEGDSMAPSLRSGDLLVYLRIGYELKYGDLIILRDPDGGMDIVKRVAALEGDSLSLTLDGQLTRNEVQVDEPYAWYGNQDTTRWQRFPLEIGEGEVFILGDNRGVSLDSRISGPARMDLVDGKVLFSLRLFSE